MARENQIPFVDGIIHETVTLQWDIEITRFSGNNWRPLVIVKRLIRPDGTGVKGFFKVFVQIGTQTAPGSPSSFGIDARSVFIGKDPITVSKFEATPIRAVKEQFSRMVAVFFRFQRDRKGPAGVSVQALTPDPKVPGRYIAAPGVWI